MSSSTRKKKHALRSREKKPRGVGVSKVITSSSTDYCKEAPSTEYMIDPKGQRYKTISYRWNKKRSLAPKIKPIKRFGIYKIIDWKF